MTSPFALFLRTLAGAALTCAVAASAVAQTTDATPVPEAAAPADDNGTIPAGGRFRECHGYIRHVSEINMKLHCIDGNPSDQSFLYLPKFANLRDGKTVQLRELLPETPVHVFYTQTLGIKKAYKVFVADPNGNGVYGFRT